MSILDMSCIALISASVGPAPVTSGPRRTSDRTLGEPAPTPKVGGGTGESVNHRNRRAADQARESAGDNVGRLDHYQSSMSAVGAAVTGVVMAGKPAARIRSTRRRA